MGHRLLVKNKFFPLLIFIFFLIALCNSCGPSVKFVELEEPESKIEKGCVSFSVPKDEKWYVNKHWVTYLPPDDPCDADIRLVSGGGDSVNHIYIEGDRGAWKEEYSMESEYYLHMLDRDHNIYLQDSRFITVLDYKKEVCKNTKEICVKGYYKLSTSSRLPNFDTGEAQLNTSEKFYYEIITHYIIFGPYKVWPSWPYAGEAYYVDYYYVIESTEDLSDSDIESKANEILKTIEYELAEKLEKLTIEKDN